MFLCQNKLIMILKKLNVQSLGIPLSSFTEEDFSKVYIKFAMFNFKLFLVIILPIM